VDKDEALKLALEVLEKIYEGCGNVIEDKLHENAVTLAKLVREDCNKPITAIKEALAQPEQESDDLTIAYMTGFHAGKNTPQREWIGLTDEDKNNCLVSADPCECLAKPESHQLMEDVEAKLRDKNSC
jgi:hypothetical protein